jgi:hypothetical protein
MGSREVDDALLPTPSAVVGESSSVAAPELSEKTGIQQYADSIDTTPTPKLREVFGAYRQTQHKPATEQMIAELCEAMEPVTNSLTVFPADLDEGDDEEREVTLTRRELKRIVRIRDAFQAQGAAR